MPEDVERQPSLNQRVSNYLRETHSGENPFANKTQAAEIDRREFELQRALNDLRTAQAKVEKIRGEIRKLKA
ncbi:MAG: hypothetical protein Hals2KO_22170 [Halioglobus sp.]